MAESGDRPKSTVERWVELGLYDLDTARAMLGSGRWLYVLFCCQQAVEKVLKAKIVQTTGEHPPRLHNLVRLAERAGIQPDSAKADRLRFLTAYYIESRYPDHLEDLAHRCTRELATEVFGYTEEMVEWLRSLLT